MNKSLQLPETAGSFKPPASTVFIGELALQRSSRAATTYLTAIRLETLGNISDQ